MSNGHCCGLCNIRIAFYIKKLQTYYQNPLVNLNCQKNTLISLITVEVEINVEGGIYWKKLVHKCNKRGVEGGKNLRIH